MAFGLEGVALGALISAYSAAASTAVNAVTGKQRADSAAKRSRQAQQAAAGTATAEKTQAAMKEREMKAEEIDPTAILEAEQDAVGSMARSRMGGMDPNQMRLGMNALLGEGGDYA